MRQHYRWMRVLIAGSLFLGAACNASESDKLTRMLDDFLAGASSGSVEAHERFWAEDLVYTSSNGTRTNKAKILQGMRAATGGENASGGDAESRVVYSAEDVDIRIYGDTAIVAFRLIGSLPDKGAIESQYFNTGTFLKRDGTWQVVAWQATKIPDVQSTG